MFKTIANWFKKPELKYPGEFEYIRIPDILGDWDQTNNKYEESQNGMICIEIFPFHENINHWSKVVSIVYFDGWMENPFRAASAATLTSLEEASNIWKIVDISDNAVIYETINYIEDEKEDRKSTLVEVGELYDYGIIGSITECEIGLCLLGKDGLHTFSYTEKNKISPSNREIWLNEIRKIVVSKNIPEL